MSRIKVQKHGAFENIVILLIKQTNSDYNKFIAWQVFCENCHHCIFTNVKEPDAWKLRL